MKPKAGNRRSTINSSGGKKQTLWRERGAVVDVRGGGGGLPELPEGETQKVGGYRGNTFIKPPAGDGGGLRGRGEGVRGRGEGDALWLQITVVSAAGAQ